MTDSSGSSAVLSDSSPPSSNVLIVEARFYDGLADMLVRGAENALRIAGAVMDRVSVPGALEIPGAIALAERAGRYDAYVALGCVIRGETGHYDIVAEQSSRGLMDLTLQGLAIGNGILTVEDFAQAEARANPGQKDKGGDAARAALAMLALKRRFRA